MAEQRRSMEKQHAATRAHDPRDERVRKRADRRFGDLSIGADQEDRRSEQSHRGGDHITLAIKVGEHAEPVGERSGSTHHPADASGLERSRNGRPGGGRAQAHAAHARLLRPSLATFPRRRPMPTRRRCRSCANQSARLRRRWPTRTASASYTREYPCSTKRSLRRRQVPRREEPQLPGRPPGLVNQRFVDALKRPISRNVNRAAGYSDVVRAGSVTRRDVIWAITVALLTGTLFLVTLRNDVGGTEDSPSSSSSDRSSAPPTPRYPSLPSRPRLHARASRHARVSRQPVFSCVRIFSCIFASS